MFFLKLLFPRASKTSWGTSRGLTDRDINTLYAIWRKICNAKRYGYRDVMVYMIDTVPIPFIDFLESRGYKVNIYDRQDGVVEVIISW